MANTSLCLNCVIFEIDIFFLLNLKSLLASKIFLLTFLLLFVHFSYLKNKWGIFHSGVKFIDKGADAANMEILGVSTTPGRPQCPFLSRYSEVHIWH